MSKYEELKLKYGDPLPYSELTEKELLYIKSDVTATNEMFEMFKDELFVNEEVTKNDKI